MTTDGNTLIQMSDLAIGHTKRALLKGIDLEVRLGDFLAVVGPNGAGKTTLLSTMLGSLRPLSGRVTRREGLVVGYVPQRGRHDPVFGLTVSDVVGSGGLGLGSWGAADLHFAPQARIREALVQLGIAPLGNHRFRDLSGGQQQRVLVARAVVRKPQLLVLDEPTAGMDLPSERDLLELVAKLPSTGEAAVILVTHQLALAAHYAQTIAVLNKDDGVFAVDEKDKLLTPSRLSDVYRRPMAARCHNGDWFIHPRSDQGAP